MLMVRNSHRLLCSTNNELLCGASFAKMPLFESTGVGRRAEVAVGDGFEPPLRLERLGKVLKTATPWLRLVPVQLPPGPEEPIPGSWTAPRPSERRGRSSSPSAFGLFGWVLRNQVLQCIRPKTESHQSGGGGKWAQGFDLGSGRGKHTEQGNRQHD